MKNKIILYIVCMYVYWSCCCVCMCVCIYCVTIVFEGPVNWRGLVRFLHDPSLPLYFLLGSKARQANPGVGFGRKIF